MTQGQDKKKQNTLESQEDPSVVTWDEGKRA